MSAFERLTSLGNNDVNFAETTATHATSTTLGFGVLLLLPAKQRTLPPKLPSSSRKRRMLADHALCDMPGCIMLHHAMATTISPCMAARQY